MDGVDKIFQIGLYSLLSTFYGMSVNMYKLIINLIFYELRYNIYIRPGWVIHSRKLWKIVRKFGVRKGERCLQKTITFYRNTKEKIHMFFFAESATRFPGKI